MALKRLQQSFDEKYRDCTSVDQCLNIYNESEYEEDRHFALEKIVEFKGGPQKLVRMLNDGEILDRREIAAATTSLSRMDPKEAPIEDIMDLLKCENAYLRNQAISVLQDYGKEIKYFIVKFLIGDDRDLRIFAINVLGDVNFAESREMMIELLQSEQDVNVAMTAVDYLAEIGEPEDVAFLEKLKTRFNDEPYVKFAVDNAIRVIQG